MRAQVHGTSIVFLASNASPEEVAAVSSSLLSHATCNPSRCTDSLVNTPDLRHSIVYPKFLLQVASLRRGLAHRPVVVYESPAKPAQTGAHNAQPVVGYGAPELAVIDTMVCALADRFLGIACARNMRLRPSRVPTAVLVHGFASRHIHAIVPVPSHARAWYPFRHDIAITQ